MNFEFSKIFLRSLRMESFFTAKDAKAFLQRAQRGFLSYYAFKVFSTYFAVSFAFFAVGDFFFTAKGAKGIFELLRFQGFLCVLCV